MALVQIKHEANDEMGAPAPVDEAPNWILDPLHSGDKEQGKRAFLRMVSHELRTPLNSIIGFSEILRQELYGPLGSPNYMEYAGIIRESGIKLLNLFNNFLDIIRLDGTTSDLVPTLEPVMSALQEAAHRINPEACARGVRIEVRLIDAEMCAIFDPRGVASCLDHLLHNAIDFTAIGDSIELDAIACDHTVQISVFNRGPAPDPAEIERLMHPFEQGSSEHNRSRQGAGLGWAIVRLNCLAMGGEFRVVSREGQSLRAILSLKRAL